MDRLPAFETSLRFQNLRLVVLTSAWGQPKLRVIEQEEANVVIGFYFSVESLCPVESNSYTVLPGISSAALECFVLEIVAVAFPRSVAMLATVSAQPDLGNV